MSHDPGSRPTPDRALTDIADYVAGFEIRNANAYRIARYCVMDALGCAVAAIGFPECTKLLGPVVPGADLPGGARVPGTAFELDPVGAAFNIAAMIRWLDLNDAFPAAVGSGHPSDNLGAILATADYLSRSRVREGKAPLTMRDVLTALIKSYEIQGVFSLGNDLSRHGYDYVPFPRVAATAVVTAMLGGGRERIVNAVSNAWADGAALNIYRHQNNTGPRKGWAGAEAASRSVRLALMAVKGEMGYPSVLTAKKAGFYDALLGGKPLELVQPYGSFVLENIMFKLVPTVSYGQSAVECALKLHPLVRGRLEDIESIAISSHEKVIANMDKRGPLTNHAERDHCVQYVVAVALIHGALDASNFDDEFAADPRIDSLRSKMTLAEEPRYTEARRDPARRWNANAVEVRFSDGTRTPKVEIPYPGGHPQRREEGIPLLEQKFRRHLAGCFPAQQQEAIAGLFADQADFEAMPVDVFCGYWKGEFGSARSA